MGYRPLERAPLFSHDTIGDNTTQHGETISKLMVELVSENNGRQEELLPFVRRKLYDADIQLFDTHALFERILAHPESTYGMLRFPKFVEGKAFADTLSRRAIQHRQLVSLLLDGRVSHLQRPESLYVHGRLASY
jgi:hypothetical protein